jgi:DNA-binding NarL/FixJ family response regulator
MSRSPTDTGPVPSEPVRDGRYEELRVLLVDDHEGFRRAARALLAAASFVVVGEAADAAGALRQVGELRPDVVLLDVQLPDGDGFDVAGVLAGLPEPPRVVLVSGRDRSDYGSLVERSAVCGFVGKDELSGAALRDLLGGPPPES